VLPVLCCNVHLPLLRKVRSHWIAGAALAPALLARRTRPQYFWCGALSSFGAVAVLLLLLLLLPCCCCWSGAAEFTSYCCCQSAAVGPPGRWFAASFGAANAIQLERCTPFLQCCYLVQLPLLLLLLLEQRCTSTTLCLWCCCCGSARPLDR